jgi:hypothetical protein
LLSTPSTPWRRRFIIYFFSLLLLAPPHSVLSLHLLNRRIENRIIHNRKQTDRQRNENNSHIGGSGMLSLDDGFGIDSTASVWCYELCLDFSWWKCW